MSCKSWGTDLEAEHVWSTAPLTKLAEIIHPAPDNSVLTAANALRVRGMVLAYLVLDQSQYTEYDAHYLPSLETNIARLSEPKIIEKEMTRTI